MNTATLEPPLAEPRQDEVFTTVADVLARLDVPPERIRLHPRPGTATVEDAVRITERKIALCELVEDTLVEKTMGVYESWLAAELIGILRDFLKQNPFGIVTGADGMLLLETKMLRIPDVSFISHERLPQGGLKNAPAAPLLIPDLAVEVISEGNRPAEMDRKLREYFGHGVRLVWYVYPATETIRACSAPTSFRDCAGDDLLLGGDVLPGFELRVADLFTGPRQAPSGEKGA